MLSAGVAAILLVGALHGHRLTEALPLRAVDLNEAPVQGLVFRNAHGAPAASPTDTDGSTSIRIGEAAGSSGWMRITLSTADSPKLDVELLEPWNGLLPLSNRSELDSGPFTVTVVGVPIQSRSIDSRIATSVAAGILAQEAYRSVSTAAERGERLQLLTDRANRLGVTPESLQGAINGLAGRADSKFATGVGSLWNGDLATASDRLLEVWKESEAANFAALTEAVDSAQFLGITYLRQGEAGRAAVLLAKACDLRPGDLDLLALLGTALHGVGNFSDAESALRQVLEGREAERGGDHQSLSPTLNNLAILYFEQGRYEQARTLNERALAIEEASSSPNHPSVVALLTNLAAIHTALGDPVSAEPLLRRALQIEEEAHGEAGVELASTLNNLALVYFETGILL